MKKKTLLVVAFLAALFLFPAAVAGSNAVKAYVFPLESPVYEYMDALYSLCGLARPSANRPWSDAEAR